MANATPAAVPNRKRADRELTAVPLLRFEIETGAELKVEVLCAAALPETIHPESSRLVDILPRNPVYEGRRATMDSVSEGQDYEPVVATPEYDAARPRHASARSGK